MFFFISAVSLGKTLLFGNRRLGLVIAIAAIPLFGVINVLYTPFHESFLMIPFFLLLIFLNIRNPERKEYTYLLILCTIALVFFHPLISLFVILFLLLADVYLHVIAPEKSRRIKHSSARC